MTSVSIPLAIRAAAVCAALALVPLPLMAVPVPTAAIDCEEHCCCGPSGGSMPASCACKPCASAGGISLRAEVSNLPAFDPPAPTGFDFVRGSFPPARGERPLSPPPRATV